MGPLVAVTRTVAPTAARWQPLARMPRAVRQVQQVAQPRLAVPRRQAQREAQPGRAVQGQQVETLAVAVPKASAELLQPEAFVRQVAPTRMAEPYQRAAQKPLVEPLQSAVQTQPVVPLQPVVQE